MGNWRRTPRELAGKRAIVTGASSGIGRALAVQMAHAGVRQVLLARRGDRLREVCAAIEPAYAEAVTGDVTHPDVRAAALARAQQRFGGVDLLVNNAGAGAYGRFVDASPDRLRRMMEVNLFAPAEFIREAAPSLRVGDDPVVVNIGSILGRRGVPLSSEYNASKFAIHGLSESIRPELRRLGVELLLVAPGTTETGFKRNLIERAASPPWANRRGASAEAVAARVVRAIECRRRFVVPSFSGWWLVLAARLAPGLLDRWLERWG